MTRDNTTFRIIFLGTPRFAVASLEILVKNNFQVVAVVTAPDKPSGRGLSLQQSEVKQFALQKKIPVLQPVKLSDPQFLEEIKLYKADLQVVVAFRMLPELVWNMPRLGTFNLHASLLPKYRGAAPINHAIINGETETGVTTFFLKKEIDTGDIIFFEKINIGETETAGELHDRLMNYGAELVLKTVRHIQEGTYKTVKQESMLPALSELVPAPKIFKNDCRVNWNYTPAKIHNFIRGLSPYPTAWTELCAPDHNRYTLKLFVVEPVLFSHSKSYGEIETDGKKFLHIFCDGGYLKIVELQLAGKKRMKTTDLLLGFPIHGAWNAE